MKLNLFLLVMLSLTCSVKGYAHQITINIDNVNSSNGKVRCGLYTSSKGFPESSDTRMLQTVVEANEQGVSCLFTKVPAGYYAATVLHDENDNEEMDKNFLGVPKESWGVSNNVTPTLRAPTFDEAMFEVANSVAINIHLVD